MIAMLGRPELDTEVSDAGMGTTESDDCRRVSKKDGDANGVLARDFPAKMDRSLSTHLPSQSVDCVEQASYIQGPKSRKNQAE